MPGPDGICWDIFLSSSHWFTCLRWTWATRWSLKACAPTFARCLTHRPVAAGAGASEAKLLHRQHPHPAAARLAPPAPDDDIHRLALGHLGPAAAVLRPPRPGSSKWHCNFFRTTPNARKPTTCRLIGLCPPPDCGRNPPPPGPSRRCPVTAPTPRGPARAFPTPLRSPGWLLPPGRRPDGLHHHAPARAGGTRHPTSWQPPLPHDGSCSNSPTGGRTTTRAGG